VKRLLVWITALTVVFSGMIPLTGALGRTAPPPEFAKWFTYPDGSPCSMPCLFGIQPGVTTPDEVRKILKTHPLLNESHFSAVQNDVGMGDRVGEQFEFQPGNRIGFAVLDIVYKPTNSPIDAVFIATPTTGQAQVPLQDVFNVLGIPQKVRPSHARDNKWTEFLFRDNTFYVELPDFNFDCVFAVGRSVTAIYMYRAGYFEEMLREEEKSSNYHPYYAPWMGLIRNTCWKRYYDAIGYQTPPCNP
jgi:hypothetical protein